MSSTRKGYAEAMRRKRSTSPMAERQARLRPALEKIAKKVYTTASPMVNKISHAGTGALKGYIKGTESLAMKLKPILDKLPKGPTKHRISPRARMRMKQ